MTVGNDRELEHEERIARVLRRRPGVMQVPPFTAVERRLARAVSVPFALATGGAIVLIALVVGGLIAERRAGVPATTGAPLPSATPGLSSPTSGPPDASASVLDDRFGFLWSQEPSSTGLRVRAETGQPVLEVSARPYGFSVCGCAVSPEGTRIAYWANTVGGKLRIIDVARPDQQTTIYTAPAEHRVSAAAWSSDGTGLLVAIERENAPGGPDRGPLSSSLLIVEASGGTPRTLHADGGVFVPLGWDRQAGLATAAESGPGGYVVGYVTVRTTGDPAPRLASVEESMLMLSIDVSLDQRFVLGVVSDSSGSTLRWWRMDDFGTMAKGPRVDDQSVPKWRPLTPQIAWIDAGGILHLLDVERGESAVGGSLPADYRLSAFRRDGSAVVASAASKHILMELSSGRTAGFSAAGQITGSVRLR